MTEEELLSLIRTPRRPEHTGESASNARANRQQFADIDALLGSLAEVLPQMGPGRSYYDEAGRLRTTNSPAQQAYNVAQTVGPLGMIDSSISPGTVRMISAWHGSPHKFDNFDVSKVGTGEGAQAYGHGIYTAENKGIAQWYRDKLSGFDYEPGETPSAPKGSLADRLGKIFGDDGSKWDRGSRNIGDYARRMAVGSKELEDDVIAYQLADGSRFISTPEWWDTAAPSTEGYLYKTSLEWPDAAREAADPLSKEHFIDWDSDKGKFWRDALAKYGSSESAMAGLLNEGYPGIRYTDAVSRHAQDGATHNFVLFDDRIPKIVERNGQPVGSALDDLLSSIPKRGAK